MPLVCSSNEVRSPVYAAVSHGLLAGPAIERLDASPIERLFMTDSVETQPLAFSPTRSKLFRSLVSSARPFDELRAAKSISVLFS